ncbi:MAG TPA: BON domain-containing protein [Acidiferrobacter sp.]|nr:BON domain-containing protein [Acidiferrobacter sp.]
MHPTIGELLRGLTAGVIALALAGCTPLLIGGTATGAAVIGDQRSVGVVVDDTLIELQIEAVIAENKPLHRETHVEVMSVNGLVLLTGEAGTIAERNDVLTIVRKINGVRRIVNQLRIAPPSSFTARLADSWITLRVKSALVAHHLNADQIKVVTANRVVYLLGIVPPAQGNEAALIASRIPDVLSIIELFEHHP